MSNHNLYMCAHISFYSTLRLACATVSACVKAQRPREDLETAFEEQLDAQKI